MARPGQPPDQAGGVAFVFQGGGSLAAPQVGMLCALSGAGLLPDLVVGSSAGALNAVAAASDPSPAGLGRLEAVWLPLRRQRVAPFSARAWVSYVLPTAATGQRTDSQPSPRRPACPSAGVI